MKKLVLVLLGIGIVADIGIMMSEYRAHKKYNKGFADGANFAFALKDLENIVKGIKEKHE